MRTITFVFALLLAGLSAQASSPSYLQSLISQAHEKDLAHDRAWLNLVHYKKSLWGGYSSEIDSPSFFLSSDGKSDPVKELDATLRGFFRETPRAYPAIHGTKPESQFPRCQFPARFLWLSRELSIDPARLPAADCSRYEEFRDRLAAKSASLVFSSYYLNNPSSMFGHSFLRINRSGIDDRNRDRYELLDHGIGFAAEVTTSNSLLYAIYGLTGVFHGTYSDVPYYFKVREYNDYESRDLWSYDLNLKPRELEMLIAHLWEMGSAYSSYYYFKRNCSYEILRVLEAAAPRLHLSGPFWLYSIPSDTLKQLMRTPGLVARVEYRPSARSLFYKRLSLLNVAEKDLLSKMIRMNADPKMISSEPAETQARVLDAALDYLDFKYPENLVAKDTPSSRLRQRLLVARAETGVSTVPPAFNPSPDEQPQNGHGSGRVGFEGGGESGRGGFTQVDLRFALHDLLDPLAGYPANAKIEFGDFQGRIDWPTHQFEVESLTAFQVTSLNPLTRWNHGASWRVGFGARRIRDHDCSRCLAANAQFGLGYSLAPTDGITAFAFADSLADSSPELYLAKARLGLGPRAGVLLHEGPLSALFEGGYHAMLFSTERDVYEASGEIRWSFSDSSAIFVRGADYTASREGALGAFLYF